MHFSLCPPVSYFPTITARPWSTGGGPKRPALRRPAPSRLQRRWEADGDGAPSPCPPVPPPPPPSAPAEAVAASPVGAATARGGEASPSGPLSRQYAEIQQAASVVKMSAELTATMLGAMDVIATAPRETVPSSVGTAPTSTSTMLNEILIGMLHHRPDVVATVDRSSSNLEESLARKDSISSTGPMRSRRGSRLLGEAPPMDELHGDMKSLHAALDALVAGSQRLLKTQIAGKTLGEAPLQQLCDNSTRAMLAFHGMASAGGGMWIPRSRPSVAAPPRLSTSANPEMYLICVAFECPLRLATDLDHTAWVETRRILQSLIINTIRKCQGCILQESEDGCASFLSFETPGSAVCYARCLQKYTPYLPWGAECLSLPYCAEVPHPEATVWMNNLAEWQPKLRASVQSPHRSWSNAMSDVVRAARSMENDMECVFAHYVLRTAAVYKSEVDERRHSVTFDGWETSAVRLSATDPSIIAVAADVALTGGEALSDGADNVLSLHWLGGSVECFLQRGPAIKVGLHGGSMLDTSLVHNVKCVASCVCAMAMGGQCVASQAFLELAAPRVTCESLHCRALPVEGGILAARERETATIATLGGVQGGAPSALVFGHLPARHAVRKAKKGGASDDFDAAWWLRSLPILRTAHPLRRTEGTQTDDARRASSYIVRYPSKDGSDAPLRMEKTRARTASRGSLFPSQSAGNGTGEHATVQLPPYYAAGHAATPVVQGEVFVAELGVQTSAETPMSRGITEAALDAVATCWELKSGRSSEDDRARRTMQRVLTAQPPRRIAPSWESLMKAAHETLRCNRITPGIDTIEAIRAALVSLTCLVAEFGRNQSMRASQSSIDEPLSPWTIDAASMVE